MKIHRTILFLPVFALIFLSCRGEITAADSLNNPEKINPHLVSKEQAVENLKNFLSSIEGSSVKSSDYSKERTIKDIKSISLSALRTKSPTEFPDSIGSEEIVYIVNFENEDGYAILAADDRIGSDVIAVTDSGAISETDVFESLQQPSLPLNNGYDTLYFELEDSIAVVELPTTAVLNTYLETYGEFPVGVQMPHADNEVPKHLTTYLCVQYAVDEIADAPSGGSGNENVTTLVTYQRDSVIQTVKPILKDMSTWRQKAPFNSYCPKIWFGGGEHTPAGCVPLALAQIMTHFKYPSEVKYKKKMVNWDALKTSWNKTDQGKESAGILLRRIGNACGSVYTRWGTFTFPSSAKHALSCKFNYKNVELKNYNNSDVLHSLNADCPVFICSLPSRNWHDYDFANSHGWVLDGYGTRKRTTTVTTFRDGVQQSEPEVRNDTLTMVHCNFGWGGDCNGYFVSGIFDLRSPDAQFDSIVNDNTNYNCYLKIITYDNPNN